MNTQAQNLHASDDHSFQNHKEIATVSDLAKQAIELSKQLATPPYPKCYEVLYTHLTKSNLSLSQEIDALIDEKNVVSKEHIEKLHTNFLDTNSNLEEVRNDTNQKLEKELDEISSMLDSYAVANNNYCSTLKASVREISKINTASDLVSKVTELICENEKMRADAEELNATLENSREQIHDLKRCLSAAIDDSMRDALTGLGNRRWLERDISYLLKSEDSSDHSHCFVLIDLDHFKKINDEFGHIVGDKVLKFFSKILVENVKGKDICTRFGGEEFSVTLRNTNVKNAEKIMEVVREKLEASRLILSTSKQPIGVVTASFGITQIRNNETFEDLYNRADANLYEAKQRGRNQIVSCSLDKY